MRYLFFLLPTLLFVFCSNENKNLSKSKQKNDAVVQKELIIPKNVSEIPLPQGFERIKVDSGSFEYYLRNFLLADDNTVYYFNGDKKYNQSLHYAVLDIDVGTRDLQQCADAVMRLRAEYLFETKQYSKIHFNFLGDGKPRYYTNYAGTNRTYGKFRKYMDYIFAYANTSSLHDEMKKVDIEEMKIGDVFIQKGRPYGHSIMIVDMAENLKTGEKIFLIVQSFMPAQSIHILKNFNDSSLNPWYSLNFGEELYTPEWTFTKDDLRRFK